jgi:DNA polymerase III subunit beta
MKRRVNLKKENLNMNNIALTYNPISVSEPQPMVTTANRKAFATALKTVCMGVEKRNKEPILDCVKLTMQGGKMTIEGTDLDTVSRVTIAAAPCDGFTACIPAFSLLKLVDKALCETVTLTIQSEPWIEQIEVEATNYQEACTRELTHDGKILIGVGLGNVTMNTLPVESFPEIKTDFTPETATVFSLSAPVLNEAFSKCAVAISTEESRYYLNGIYLHFSATDVMGLRGLLACSTDGHRMVLRSIAALVPTSMPGVIVPRKTVLQMIKLTAKSKDQVRITVSQTKIRFWVGDVMITSKLIDGIFPDYQRVIPRHNDEKWEMDTVQLISAIEQVTTISQEKSRCVKFEFGRGQLKLSVLTAENGCSELEIQARDESLKGELTIGFNSSYILDAAKSCGKAMQFHLNDYGSPTLITDESDPRGIAVLMPMRV